MGSQRVMQNMGFERMRRDPRSETHGLLAQYCRHIVAARRVAQLITATEQRKH